MAHDPVGRVVRGPWLRATGHTPASHRDRTL